jgi:hypothetical protein
VVHAALVYWGSFDWHGMAQAAIFLGFEFVAQGYVYPISLIACPRHPVKGLTCE